MFDGCKNLKEIKFGKSFDTSKVTIMQRMFFGCSGLTELDLSNFDTSSVTNMAGMFYRCKSLSEIKVSKDKWIISDEVNQDQMFYGCGTDEFTYID